MSTLKNMIGERFGKLLVIKKVPSTNGNTRWECLCDCGKHKEFQAGMLRTGRARSCGCLRSNVNKSLDITGRAFGRLTAVSRYDGEGATQWNCLCDCGKSVVVKLSNLQSGNTRSCGCFRHELHTLPGRDKAINDVIYEYTSSARKRNLIYALTREDAVKLFDGTCHYCGSPPSRIKAAKSRTGKALIYNGIDRVDNEKGYTLDNCVSCCFPCNRFKGDRTLEDFKKHVRAIYDKCLDPV